jgi:uncharacterized RDD family membrane protein YckC
MNSIKCFQCGLVNWANAETCKRCQAVLQAATDADQPPPPQPLGWQQTEQDSAPHSAPQPAWQPPPVYGPYPSYADYRPATDAMMVLASRGSRLAASLLDSACFVVPVLVCVLLFVFIGQALGAGNDALPVILFTVLGLVVLAILLIQLSLLSMNGQTIGKRWLGIRIVKVETGENGGFKTNALLRSIVPGLIGGIPIVGPLFRLADIFFIFREDQRCLHDLIAGTCVIKA